MFLKKRRAKEAAWAMRLQALDDKLSRVTDELRGIREDTGEIRKGVTDELRAIREDTGEIRKGITQGFVPNEAKRDPDVLSESERVNKWIMGENGDGI